MTKNKFNFLASAKKTILIEAKAVSDIQKQLDTNFNKFCEAANHSKGKIVIMGVGKSGHIGKRFLQLYLVRVQIVFLYILLRPLMETWVY